MHLPFPDITAAHNMPYQYLAHQPLLLFTYLEVINGNYSLGLIDLERPLVI